MLSGSSNFRGKIVPCFRGESGHFCRVLPFVTFYKEMMELMRPACHLFSKARGYALAAHGTQTQT